MKPDPEFSHIDDLGRASMVNVGAKPVSAREAWAEGYIYLRPETLAAIRGGGSPQRGCSFGRPGGGHLGG